MNGNDFLPRGVTHELASKYVNHLRAILLFSDLTFLREDLLTIHMNSTSKKDIAYPLPKELKKIIQMLLSLQLVDTGQL